MKWSKMNVENSKKYIVDIKRRYEVGDVVIKVSKGFIKFIENTLDHIKRNKKMYKKLVYYIALCLFLYTVPDIIHMIESFDYVGFINQVKTMPKEMLIDSVLILIKAIAKWSVMILVTKDILKNILTTGKVFK